ncbi:hypothetical protein DL93DRAFT_8248 [Clavulina sp. PMI_390]|nr:hypothetical protein DL93DRAFT_8248 [Clavulina sp. PMI_390]
MAARTPNMQRESAARRGFTIQHQKVALNIDLAGFVRGYTELTVIPNNANLRTLHLHSRQCTIDNVSVAGQPADFVLQDPQSNLGPSKPDDVHGFAEMKRKMFTAFSEADEGELSIALPPSLLPVPRSVPSEPKEGTPSTSNPSRQSNSTSEFAPISVLIHYSMRSPSNGLEFVLPTDAYPYVSHIRSSQ